MWILNSMSLTNEEDEAQVQPVNLMEFDPDSELIFETPPQDVVCSITRCFEEFRNTFETDKSLDSDSGESLFITQSVTSRRRRRRPSNRSESLTEIDSENESRCPEEEDLEEEEEILSCHKHISSQKRKRVTYIPPKKVFFPFLKSQRGLIRQKKQILENTEIGGFFKCLKKIKQGYNYTEDAKVLEMEPHDTSDLEDENSHCDVRVVNKTVFVPSAYRRNKQKWLSEAILKRRSKNARLAKTKLKNAEDLQQAKRKSKKMKSKDASMSPPGVFVHVELETQHEALEVLAACSDELSDSDGSSWQGSGEKPSDAHLCVIEETQRLNSVEVASGALQEDVRAGEDANSFTPPPEEDVSTEWSVCVSTRSEDVSTQSEEDVSTQSKTLCHSWETSSQDLFMPVDLQEDESSQTPIDASPSVTRKPETFGTIVERFQMSRKAETEPAEALTTMGDSDETHIDTDNEYVSKSGPRTPRREECSPLTGVKSVSQECEEGTNKITTPDSMSPAQSIFTCSANSTKHSVPQDISQSSSGPQVEPLQENEGEEKKRQKASLSDKGAEVADEEETPCMQPESVVLEHPTETVDSPLFKPVGLGFLKRKRRKKETVTADKDSNSELCDTDVSSASHHVVITEAETTHKDRRKSGEVEENETNEEEMTASVSQSCHTSAGILRVKKKQVKLVNKEMEQSEKQQHESDLHLCPASQTDDVIEPEVVCQRDNASTQETVECLERNTKVTLNVAKCKTKSHSLSSLSQGDDITELKNTAEPPEITSKLVDSDRAVKKKKNKLKKQDAESGLNTQSEENIHSFETVEYSKSKTTVLCSKKTKKRRNKEAEKMRDEENNAAVEPMNETLEHADELTVNNLIHSTETHQPENREKSEEVKCPSPGVTTLKTVRKRRRDERETQQNGYPDVTTDVCSVSLFDEVTGLQEENESTTPEMLEELSEHAKGKKKKKKKKKKKEMNSELICAGEQPEETVTLEGKKNMSCELHEESVDQEDAFRNSESVASTPGKKKRKKNWEILDNSDLSYSVEQPEETAERKKKKKKQLNGFMTVSNELHEENGNSASVASTTCEKKRKKNKTILDSSDITCALGQPEEPVTPEKRKKKKPLNNLMNVSSELHEVSVDHENAFRNSESVSSTPGEKRRKKNWEILDSSDLSYSVEKPEETVTTERRKKKQLNDFMNVNELHEENGNSPSVASTTSEKKRKKHKKMMDSSDLICAVEEPEEPVTPERRKKKKKQLNDFMKVSNELHEECVDHEAPFRNSESVASAPGEKKKTKKKKTEIMEADQSSSPVADKESVSVLDTQNFPVINETSQIERTETVIPNDDVLNKKKKKKRRKNIKNN